MTEEKANEIKEVMEESIEDRVKQVRLNLVQYQIEGYPDRSNWRETYHEKTTPEKMRFWCGEIGQTMRWQVESGFDEMSVFSKDDLENWLKIDPDFEYYLPYIIKVLRLRKEEVYQAIKR